MFSNSYTSKRHVEKPAIEAMTGQSSTGDLTLTISRAIFVGIGVIGFVLLFHGK